MHARQARNWEIPSPDSHPFKTKKIKPPTLTTRRRGTIRSPTICRHPRPDRGVARRSKVVGGRAGRRRPGSRRIVQTAQPPEPRDYTRFALEWFALSFSPFSSPLVTICDNLWLGAFVLDSHFHGNDEVSGIPTRVHRSSIIDLRCRLSSPT
jgi:hypothetical protein